jgi:hypothetical protein
MVAERQMTIRGAPPTIESWTRALSNPGGGWSRGTEISGR